MRLRYGIAFYHNIHCRDTVSYFGSIRTVIHSAPAMENLLQNTIRTDNLGTFLSNIRSTMVVWTLHGRWNIDHVRNIINYFMQSLITRGVALFICKVNKWIMCCYYCSCSCCPDWSATSNSGIVYNCAIFVYGFFIPSGIILFCNAAVVWSIRKVSC